ncbi:preprotein translocase, SecE subunit [Solidesulfovibrio fructosivorans JJ]]|uniref:Protein translocase subunit SecE n=1 Tax=Solidesulfovibrio fructosivorans JJ] TaxID=596151 RepID=E1JY48_SOLFR|nr:preprotein translocase subunit SecE [Solidesulfovibrio fructosivorans]EFL50786.1 preprotein translocase, SecE subunit [Solidesulfovibrio fructosivorans JJ]]
MAKEKTQAAQGADKPLKAAAGKPSAKAEASAKSGKSLTGYVKAAQEFFEQSKVELKKVTWPTRQETIKTGVAVLVFSVIMAIYLGVVDMALSRLVAFILS